MRIDFRFFQIVLCAALLAVLNRGGAQTNFPIYGDALANGFQDWGWGARSLTCTSPVHSGTYSISYNDVAWGAISFWHPDFNPAPYTNLNFWINSGGNGGQIIQIYLQYNNAGTSAAAYQLPALPATTNWQQFFIPFSALGVAGVTNLSRLNFQLTSYGTTNPFYMDDVNLTAAPPSPVHLKIDASQTLRTADARWFGLNTAVWDGNFDTPATASVLAELGTRILRFPGGSLADDYHWATGETGTNTWAWGTSFANYVHISTNVGAQAMITVNYGTGTSDDAAAWVRSANVTNHLGYKYWEIGNECYGTWETDSNNLPHDPYTYAVRAAQYIAAMKAADPADNIKIGVVAVPGENSYVNNTTHFAVNPRTGTTNYGWTPILLSTLKSLGVTPDFLIHHVYPEWTDPNNPAASPDNDQSLLASTGNWAGDAGDLRQQIADYFGAGGTNIELLCTENNSDAGAQGKQSTSIVNGLYLADSLAQLMKTEINGFIWWDLRNGTDTGGYFGSNVYGWRTYGDLGVINGLDTRLPVFYTFKLLQFFAQPGDTVLNPATDYGQLTAYATRKADGALAVLVINKDSATTFTTQLALTDFIPWTNALVRSFGLTQDEATRTNSSVPGAQDIATNFLAVTGTNFTTTFPPYSATLLTIPPAAPKLTVWPAGGQLVLQVQGQIGVRYVVQSSTNFTTWKSAATNLLTGSDWNLTNNFASPLQFWRAAWLP